MTVKLNISAKQFDKQVNYIPFNIDSLPFIKMELKEVMKGDRKVVKRLTIYGSTFVLSLMPNMVFAQSETQTDILNPQTMFEWSMKTALVGLGASVGITILLMIVAATIRQLGGEKNRRKSKEWNTDIIKGFVQVLVAIPVVFALYYLATTIFGQLDFSKQTLLNLP